MSDRSMTPEQRAAVDYRGAMQLCIDCQHLDSPRHASACVDCIAAALKPSEAVRELYDRANEMYELLRTRDQTPTSEMVLNEYKDAREKVRQELGL